MIHCNVFLPLLTKHVMNTSVVVTLLIQSLLVGCSIVSSASLVDDAEQFTEQARYNEAIETYQRHIANRLADPTRPEWENPYFYLLQIADLQLLLTQPEDAVRSCLQAKAAGVESNLLADKLRTIARWYEEHGDFTRAFLLLKEHRDIDPLLFDALLDRVGRTLTQQENQLSVSPTAL